MEWGLAIEAPPAEQLEERTEVLLERIARLPINQLMMMKLLVNQTLYAQGLHTTQVLGTVFDGITRHTAEGYGFQHRAAARPASARRCGSATSPSATAAPRPSKAERRLRRRAGGRPRRGVPDPRRADIVGEG